MKMMLMSSVAAALAATVLSAQTTSNPAAPAKRAKISTLTLSGCVTGSEPFTLTGATGVAPRATGSESADAAKPTGPSGYRLSGSDVRPYAGQRVQVIGALVPSPNAAATMGASPASGGATSPTGVSGAMAGAPRATSPIGATALPEFRVASVRPLGPCPPR